MAVVDEMIDGFRRDVAERGPHARAHGWTHPLDAPGFRQLLMVRYHGAELVLAVAREAGVKLRQRGDYAEISAPGDRKSSTWWACRVPSERAAMELTELVAWHCDVVPSDHDIRKAMRVLESFARNGRAM